MKVALVYDRVNTWGGAERVLLALHKIFPEALLFTSVYSKEKAPWAKDLVVKTSFLQNIPFAKNNHQLFALLMPLAFESFNFDEFDLVFSITSEAGKGIITKPHTKHICICLTPTRYLWVDSANYFKNKFFKFLTFPFISYLKFWDKIAANRPDIYVAISKEVKQRIKTYYNRDSVLIYPPLTIEKNEGEQIKNDRLGNYFLVVSRLSKFARYKRVDLAIKACDKLGLNLIVVGSGDIGYFKEISGSTIKFTGQITDKELIGYYKNCKALIFPGVDDFGLAMVEAQFFGKPVIAFDKGGALEIVKNGKTGVFFKDQNIASLSLVLKDFNEKDYNSEDCKKNAAKFSFDSFEAGIKKIVKNIL